MFRMAGVDLIRYRPQPVIDYGYVRNEEMLAGLSRVKKRGLKPVTIIDVGAAEVIELGIYSVAPTTTAANARILKMFRLLLIRSPQFSIAYANHKVYCPNACEYGVLGCN